jgi:hypothetical protein
VVERQYALRISSSQTHHSRSLPSGPSTPRTHSPKCQDVGRSPKFAALLHGLEDSHIVAEAVVEARRRMRLNEGKER